MKMMQLTVTARSSSSERKFVDSFDVFYLMVEEIVPYLIYFALPM